MKSRDQSSAHVHNANEKRKRNKRISDRILLVRENDS